MNKLVTYGLAAAAVVAVLLVGSRVIGQPSNAGSPGNQASVTPSAATPQSTSVGLPVGRSHLLWDGDTAGAQITVTIPSTGWSGDRGGGVLMKNHNIDAPDGAGMIVFAGPTKLFSPESIWVYGDPCRWESTRPFAPVKTVDEAVAELSRQASRDASAPVDVTVDGHAGKLITLHVPDDAIFNTCDQNEFRTLVQGRDGARYAQDPGQIDKLYILDVNGDLAIIDAGYYKGTPQAIVDELQAIVSSMTLASPHD